LLFEFVMQLEFLLGLCRLAHPIIGHPQADNGPWLALGSLRLPSSKSQSPSPNYVGRNREFIHSHRCWVNIPDSQMSSK
jgi:hypothetical protein